MKLSRLLLVSVCISIAIMACRKDEMGFKPINNPEIISTVDHTGMVADPDGNPVSGASVLYNAEEVITDENGLYLIENVAASSVHAFLEISKDGYFDGSRTFRTSKTGTLFHRITLVPLGDPLNFAGGSGSVANNLVSINFPENSVKDELTGELYMGEVDVYVKHIGTDEFSMPGDLTAIN